MYVSIYIPISLSKSTTYVITFTSKYQIIKLELQFKLTKYLHSQILHVRRMQQTEQATLEAKSTSRTCRPRQVLRPYSRTPAPSLVPFQGPLPLALRGSAAAMERPSVGIGRQTGRDLLADGKGPARGRGRGAACRGHRRTGTGGLRGVGCGAWRGVRGAAAAAGRRGGPGRGGWASTVDGRRRRAARDSDE